MIPKEYDSFHFYQFDGKPDILETTNRCLEVIEKSGVSAQNALEVVTCLDTAVKRSNYIATKVDKFKAFPLKWNKDYYVYDPKNEDLK